MLHDEKIFRLEFFPQCVGKKVELFFRFLVRRARTGFGYLIDDTAVFNPHMNHKAIIMWMHAVMTFDVSHMPWIL